MTLRSLEIFECVARHSKMRAAATELFIAQPTISQTILELEKEYGVKLFERLSKKLYITDAGRHLLIYAKTILQTASEMERSMKDLVINRTINMGATMTVGRCVAIDIVNLYEQKYSNTKINVTIDNTVVIEQMLLSSSLDIALVEGEIKSPELLVTPAMTDELIFVCNPENQLANSESVELCDLSNVPFILREEGSGTRQTLLSLLRKHNININVKWSCHGFDAIIEAVLANQGVTVISKRIVLPLLKKKKLKEITINDVKLNRNFSLVYHKTKHIDAGTQALIDLILSK